MENKNVIIVGSEDSKRGLTEEIEKIATACNLSLVEVKENVEKFVNYLECTNDSMKELIDSVASAEFRLIDYPKERTSVIPPNFYRKRF
ncbi:MULTISPECIES: hypothetical protein [unclassified Empedobacter]|jgi:ribonuclease HII|uniref:hypothetical protein n=1 Tax=unclassified Empedobacter TaxID=2643773 RepID=UPI0025C5D699|nr:MULTISPECIES: hypothetical protein [unclassified Empedobacter]